MIRLSGFSTEGYKAFGTLTPIIRLAPITIILGRNNSGKSALCRAPLFFSYPFGIDPEIPFSLEAGGIDFGMNFSEICFNQRLDGLKATLFFDHPDIEYIKIGGATLREKAYQQIITELEIKSKRKHYKSKSILEWAEAKKILREYPILQQIPSTINWLRGVRAMPERRYKFHGQVTSIGNDGKYAPILLANSKISTNTSLFDVVTDWFRSQLSIDVNINTGEDSFSRENAFQILIKHSSQLSYSNIADAGDGISQVLPVVVGIKSLLFEKAPMLYIIEQPELHLHPYAHAAVAELMIEAAEKKTHCHLLIETHSEAFVLRIRRALAEKRLSPEQVMMYFVEENTEHKGSRVIPIELNDRGTPNWWPEGIFAEDQMEFQGIRSALRMREQ
jgi:predicted ATP-dependent endonuclease of OLD family